MSSTCPSRLTPRGTIQKRKPDATGRNGEKGGVFIQACRFFAIAAEGCHEARFPVSVEAVAPFMKCSAEEILKRGEYSFSNLKYEEGKIFFGEQIKIFREGKKFFGEQISRDEERKKR